jgi:hypothetical protein
MGRTQGSLGQELSEEARVTGGHCQIKAVQDMGLTGADYWERCLKSSPAAVPTAVALGGVKTRNSSTSVTALCVIDWGGYRQGPVGM